MWTRCARLGDVGLVICLDSGAGNYDQLWLTTSLRGMASGVLKVEILTEGIHSGDASGLVPSSFRIMRQVLDRLEDSGTGRLLPASFHCEVPAERLAQAQATAAILGDELFKRFPGRTTTAAAPPCLGPAHHHRPGRGPAGAHLAADAERDRRRRLPRHANAGNVLRPYTAFKLSLRLPPLVDAATAVQQLKACWKTTRPTRPRSRSRAELGHRLERAVHRALVRAALQDASQAHYGAACATIGQGGTIPLMNMLSQGFPTAQMMVCGVLGPKSNAHGPNEFLHLDYAQRLTASVAQVIARMP
jgi:acetylornithine deacetylase/succinyl-diaminopimelate desuccinylase-like protein